MAIFFSKVEQKVQDELAKAQQRMLLQLEGNKELRTAWEQHTEKCEAAQANGPVVLEQKQEKKIGDEQLYGKTALAFGCACQQIIYLVDEKGNLKVETNGPQKEASYLPQSTYAGKEKSESSFYATKR